jgi:hypothetical protein
MSFSLRAEAAAYATPLRSLHPAKPYPNHSCEGKVVGQLHLRPGRDELLLGKTDQLLKSRGILDRHIG